MQSLDQIRAQFTPGGSGDDATDDEIYGFILPATGKYHCILNIVIQHHVIGSYNNINNKSSRLADLLQRIIFLYNYVLMRPENNRLMPNSFY